MLCLLMQIDGIRGRDTLHEEVWDGLMARIAQSCEVFLFSFTSTTSVVVKLPRMVNRSQILAFLNVSSPLFRRKSSVKVHRDYEEV